MTEIKDYEISIIQHQKPLNVTTIIRFRILMHLDILTLLILNAIKFAYKGNRELPSPFCISTSPVHA